MINTHTHYDHVSGNVHVPASVEIIAHENTAKLMPDMSTVPGLGETANVFKDNPGKGLPKRTFKDKLTIGTGADQINLYYFGPAHTGGDAFVEFPALTRDACSATPSPTRACRSWTGPTAAREWSSPTRSRKAVDGIPNVDVIINGHTAAQTTPRRHDGNSSSSCVTS